MTNPLLLIHLRNQYMPSPLCIGDLGVIALCNAHERLETDLDMMGDYVDYLQADLATLEAEHSRICNEHALLVQESGREGRELDRLEGLLRAWVKAKGEDGGLASRELWAEAISLVKESERSGEAAT